MLPCAHLEGQVALTRAAAMSAPCPVHAVCAVQPDSTDCVHHGTMIICLGREQWQRWCIRAQHRWLPLQYAATAQVSTLQDALAAGADIGVQSTHKTLSSLTQSSMLHLKGGSVSEQRLQLALSLLQASSKCPGRRL